MYHLGIRAHKRHKLALGLFTVVVVIALAVVAYKMLHLTTAPQGHIENSHSLVTHYSADPAKKVQISEPLFMVELPYGWTKTAPASELVLKTPYTYRSLSVDGRQLAVYVDTLPLGMAVNRVVRVSANGAALSHDTVSDNCAEYTRPSAADAVSGTARAKWQGMDFLCDTGNYQRDVVGTSSMGGVNQVRLTSTKNGAHTVFITYTDNNPNPNYSILYSILDSFRLQ